MIARRITFYILMLFFVLDSQAQTAEGIIDNYLNKIGGIEQLRQLRKISFSLAGNYSGTPIQVYVESAYPNSSKLAIYMGGQELAVTEFNGTSGYTKMQGVRTPMSPDEIETQKFNSLFLTELYYRDHGFQMNYIGRIQNTYNYQYYHQIEKVYPNGESTYTYYSVETGLLAQEVASDGSYTNYSDYRSYQGYLFPYGLEIVDVNGGLIQATVTQITLEKEQGSFVPASTPSNGLRINDENAVVSRPQTTNTTRPANTSEGSYTKKIALVIGNSNYKNGGSLKNPANDARAMGAELRNLGFDVMTHFDLSQSAMKKAIDEFGQKLRSYEVGLFYYAGHGIQAKGRNYMIPVEADLKNEQQVEYDCIAADRVLAFMDYAESKVNIVVLDACRNNPFERSWRRAANGNGLAFMNAPTGSLIAYATSPGTTASDGEGSNGLYTSALLKYMKTPGLTIEQMFKRVRSEVEERSGKTQVPWESTSLKGEFYFVPED
ncbi:MAG: caspase domain-containing protein [Bacteroidota bacterium]